VLIPWLVLNIHMLVWFYKAMEGLGVGLSYKASPLFCIIVLQLPNLDQLEIWSLSVHYALSSLVIKRSLLDFDSCPISTSFPS
jgi:hypothetical protein